MRAGIAWFLLAASLCAAADYHVSPDGDDNNDGLSPTSAWRSIEYAINRVNGGDTVWIHDGTYRGRVTFTNTNGSASAPITIAAYPGASPVLKGSIVITNWIQDGTLWYTPHTVNCQQVFYNEMPLIQLGWPNEYTSQRACSCGDWFYLPHGYRCIHIPAGMFPIDVGDPRTNMPPGSFYYHAASQRLYVRLPGDAPPTNYLMEASVSLGVFYDESPVGYLRVRGLTFKHGNTLTYIPMGWPIVLIGLNGIIEDCIIEWGDVTGLTLRHNSQALRCIIRNNGMLGINCNAFTNMLIRECIVVSNNYRSFHPSYSGGIKIIPFAGATVERCEVAWNNGNGIWFDTNVAGHPNYVLNNYVHNNFIWTNRASDSTYQVTAGIYIEFTENAHVLNNIVISNGAVGIHLSASRNTRVENNLIMHTRGNPGGHRAYASLLMHNPQPGYPVVSNRLFNNLIVSNATDYDIIAHAPNNQTVFDNQIDHNLYFRGSGAGSVFPSSPFAAAYLGVGIYNSFAAWKSASGFDTHSKTNAPLLGPDRRPLPTSPAIDAGLLTPLLTTDYDDNPRPVDGNADGLAAVDIGPFERMASGAVVYVDAASTNPTPPYASWATAATNVNDAFAAASAGSAIAVRPGVYPQSAPLVITQHVAMVGIGTRENIVLHGQSSVPVLRLVASNAIANNLSLVGGFSSGDGGGAIVGPGAILQNANILQCFAFAKGGGVLAQPGSIVRRVHIANCNAEDGGGIYANSPRELSHAVLRSNVATRRGGGLYLQGPATSWWIRAESCTAYESGGGAYATAGSRLMYSTLVSNRAGRGGGAFLTGGAEVFRASIEKCSATNDGGGGAYLDGASALAESRLIHNSALIDGGGALADANSLVINSVFHDNQAAGGGGALALRGGAIAQFVTAAANSAFEGGGLHADGSATRVYNSLFWSNQASVAGTEDAHLRAGALAEQVLAGAQLDGTNNITGDPLFMGFAARDLRIRRGSPAIDRAVWIAGITNDYLQKTRSADGDGDGLVLPDLGAYENHQLRFVNLHSPSPTAPFLTWSTAAQQPQDAINASIDGDVILVASGTYNVANLRVTRGITLRSTAGPTQTIFNGNNLFRVLLLAHPSAVVEGFTLRNGLADAGAGAYVSAGKLSRCIIVSNVSNGALGGQFTYVPIIPLYYCRAGYDSMIHEGGGGVAVLHGGTLENCLIYGNSAVHGGGVVSVNGGHLRHVTIVQNYAATGGGWYGRSGSTIHNSIIYDNPLGSNYVETGTAAVWQAVTSWPLPPGVDPSDADPLFEDPANGDFRPALGSPAIDSATASPSLTLDLLGRPRPLDGNNDSIARADRGAYERIHPDSDTDGDGMPDAHEWTAGTGLTDPASFLAIQTISEANGSVDVHWPSAAGRLYTLWISTNLMTGFEIARTNLVGYPAIVETLTSPTNRELFIAVSVEGPSPD
ncbi:MAG: right-handed parallel beta-helix repeat-containing protein [Kiritimatiellae bacterium]|nr:right-handed parallel beta-helix repeat-containing protein [Kiritimatiellia bacterium]MDW8459525.1 right-handed parallel beta-helix repeat-containing protein [Verrucomicrobiota bacterium]